MRDGLPLARWLIGTSVALLIFGGGLPPVLAGESGGPSFDAARAHYAVGMMAVEKGDTISALYRFQYAIDCRPDFTEAHRQYQDLGMLTADAETIVQRYQQFVRQHPQSPLYHYLYGRILNDSKEQDQEYLAAIEADSTYPWAHYAYGVSCYAVGNDTLARAEIDRAIELGIGYAAANYYSAMLWQSSGQSDSAIAEYENALALDLRSVECWMGLGELYYGMDEYDSAIICYRNAMELAAMPAEIHARLASCFIHTRSLADAVENFQAAIEKDSENATYHVALGILLALLGRNSEAGQTMRRAEELAAQDDHVLRRLAEFYLDHQNYRKAESCLRQITGPASETGADYLLWIRYYIETGTPGLAESALQKAETAGSDTSELMYYRGLIHWHKREDDDAIRCLRKSLAYDSASTKAYILLGEIYYSRKQYRSSSNCLQQAIESGSIEPEIYSIMGDCSLMRNEYEKAADCYLEMLKQNPASEEWADGGTRIPPEKKTDYNRIWAFACCRFAQELLFTRGPAADGVIRRMLRYADELDTGNRSVKELQESLEKMTVYYSALAQSETLTRDGQISEAISQMDTATMINSANAILWARLGELYYFSMQFEKAVEHFRKAAEIDTGIPAIYAFLGESYRLLGDYAKAIVFLDKAITMDNTLGWAYEALAAARREAAGTGTPY